MPRSLFPELQYFPIGLEALVDYSAGLWYRFIDNTTVCYNGMNSKLWYLSAIYFYKCFRYDIHCKNTYLQTRQRTCSFGFAFEYVWITRFQVKPSLVNFAFILSTRVPPNFESLYCAGNSWEHTPETFFGLSNVFLRWMLWWMQSLSFVPPLGPRQSTWI